MRSKNLALALTLVAGLGTGVFLYYQKQLRKPLYGILQKEWLEERFPESVDSKDSNWQVLPYGYTLGPWPRQFRNEPILSKLSYTKGPPVKFIQSLTQLWQPVEVELTLMGPKTLVEGKKQSEWKACFESRLRCNPERGRILDYLGRKKNLENLSKAKWFDHLDPKGPRGLHLTWDFGQYWIDDFVLFTENGIAQGFSLKSVKTETGTEALSLLTQVLGNLKVNENLGPSRDWIRSKIRSVQLPQIVKISDQKEKLLRLIETQNWLFSLLSVDPTQITPFFHLAGVTHLLSLDLIKLQKTYFLNQESWILAAKPNLDQLLKYSKDFDETTIPKQIEALIQDVLLQQQRATSTLKR